MAGVLKIVLKLPIRPPGVFTGERFWLEENQPRLIEMRPPSGLSRMPASTPREADGGRSELSRRCTRRFGLKVVATLL